MSDKSNDQIRNSVRHAYASAVLAEPGAGCCGGGNATQKGVAAKLAGYTQQELTSLPLDTVVNSFGCGNPLAFSQVQDGQVVLDLGSGAGIDLLLAAKKVGPGGRVIGIDMTDEMIARAKENIAAAELSNVEVRKGLIEDLPVEAGTVDWVISNCVINLSPEKERVFAEISRVLKPGGQISISDIVVEDLPDWVRSSAALYSSCIAGAISEDAYLQGLRDAGLDQVEVTDRLVYDAVQLAGLAESDEGISSEVGCCGGTVDPSLIRQGAEALAGKVWSAKITARKPD